MIRVFEIIVDGASSTNVRKKLFKYAFHIRCQFHQHFTRQFFVQKSFWQLFSSYI